jgi:hypothetical protein
MLAIRSRLVLSIVLLTMAALLAGCAPGAPSPVPTPSPPPAAGPIENPEEAAQLVLALNPRFGDLGPPDPDMIGECCWYEAREVDGGYQVAIRIGWGDCMAGCINERVWTYAVTRDGQVALLSERGDPLEPGVLPGETGSGGGEGTGVSGTVTAGPTCPVQRPNDPDCLPRPVDGAVIIVRGQDGLEVGRVQANEGGLFTFMLPAGEYTLDPQPVEGLMGTPAPLAIRIAEGQLLPIDIQYDTGIR